jgi:hypothetical protein
VCCGGSGGGGQQTIQSSPNIPQWYLDANQSLTTRAGTESKKAYQPYTGPRVAGFNTDQEDAFALTRANQGAYQPGLSNAYTQTAAAGTSFPSANFASYMSPYQQGVIDIAKSEAVRQDDMARGSRDAAAVGAGSFGGSRHALIEAEAGRNLQRGLSDIQQTGSQAAWNQGLAQFNADRQAALGAGAQSARLGEMDQTLGLKDAASLEAIGGSQQGQTQRNLDTAYGDFLEQRGYPQSQLSFLSSILRGNDMSRLFGQTQTTQLPAPSIAGQIGGLGAGALGIAGLLGAFRRGGYVKRRLGNYAHGGQVKRYQQGGLTELSTPELLYMQNQLRRAGDPRVGAVAQEILRRRSSNAPFSGPVGGLGNLVQKYRERNATDGPDGLSGAMRSALPEAGDRDLEGTRGHAFRPEPTIEQPLPGPPRSRPAGLAAMRRSAVPTAFEDNREELIAANSGPVGIAPPIDNRDELLTENSTPYHPPAARRNDAPPWESVAAAGFRMAEAASKPGATFAGSLGAGGGEGIRNLQIRRKEAREDREQDHREKRDAATVDIAQKELALKRQIELDPNSPKVARLQAEIDESRAKVGLIYPAQADYYRGLAKRAGESDDQLYTIIPGDNGEAVGITKTGKKTPLGVPYSKLKPQASEQDIRTQALKLVAEQEEKSGIPLTPAERAAKLRQFENYLLKGADQAADPLGIR